MIKYLNESGDFRLSDGSVIDIGGIPVVTSPFLRDDEMYILGRNRVVIGTKPKTEIELARYRARWLVQQGLLDVLEWLGEKPIPMKPVPLLEGLKIRVGDAVL